MGVWVRVGGSVCVGVCVWVTEVRWVESCYCHRYLHSLPASSSLPVSEVKRVSNETLVHHLVAVCQWLKGAVEEQRQSQSPIDVADMRQRETRLRENCLALKQEVAVLGSQRVVALARSIANLQVSRVMHGDYDLQLARQEYFLHKQDKVNLECK